MLFSVSLLCFGLAFLGDSEFAKEELSKAIQICEEANSFISAMAGPIATFVFILTTELELRFNHIRGVQTVNGSGQILPIVIGGGSLLVVLWKVCSQN
jgi:hypothetical protein